MSLRQSVTLIGYMAKYKYEHKGTAMQSSYAQSADKVKVSGLWCGLKAAPLLIFNSGLDICSVLFKIYCKSYIFSVTVNFKFKRIADFL